MSNTDRLHNERMNLLSQMVQELRGDNARLSAELERVRGDLGKMREACKQAASKLPYWPQTAENILVTALSDLRAADATAGE